MSRTPVPPPPTRFGRITQANPRQLAGGHLAARTAPVVQRSVGPPVIAPPRPIGRSNPLIPPPPARSVQLSSIGASNLVTGVEQGVPWIWAGSLNLAYDGVQIPPHPIHDKLVASVGGNTFFGSFTIVFGNNVCKSYENYIEASPTKTDHTEPQYFKWLDVHLKQFSLFHAASKEFGDTAIAIKAIVIEMAQTNTPCSKATCRKEILERVKTGLWGDVVYLARLSAYQMYETQPPKVGITYDAGKKLLRSGDSAILSSPAVVHKVPDLHGQ